MKKSFSWLILLVFLSVCCEARKWTQIGASKKKSADLVGMDVKYIRLESKSGKKTKLLISSISDKDQKYLRKIIKLANPQSRVWSYPVYKKVTAKMKSASGSRVYLRKSSGEQLTVLLSNLSSTDQKYVAANRSSSGSSHRTSSSRKTLGGGTKKMGSLRALKTRTWSIKETKQIRGTLIGVDGKNLILETANGKKSLPLSSQPTINVSTANLILAQAVQAYQSKQVAKAEKGKRGKKGEPVKPVQVAVQQPAAGQAVKPAGRAVKPVVKQPGGGNQVAQVRRVNRPNAQVAVPQIQIQQPIVVPVKRKSSFRNAMPSGIMGFLTFFAANIIVYTVCLWGAMKISKCESSFFALLMSSVVVSFLSIFSIIGVLLSTPIQLGLIMWISKTSFIDTFFMLVLGNIFYMVLFFAIIVPLMI